VSKRPLPAGNPSAPDAVLAFWRAAGPDKWFVKDEAFDAEIRARYLAAHEAAAAGQLSAWEDTPEGAFALLLLLDQFPRNMFRRTPRAFATDPQARAVADRAIARGFDAHFTPPERRVFYLPLMHAEDIAAQERCVALCRDCGDVEGLKYAEEHADIIRRFGRFPHRNAILGRATTAEERRFLDDGGFAG
jgi:uncharacterized protein (DUF924 family)